jgi:hypothetical protein
MDACQLIAERKIREAMEEGVFDQLEGAGKPLDLSENPFEDPSERLANRLLKNNGFTPSWIEEAKELEAEARRLRAQGDASKQDVLDRIAALNRRIVSFNLRTPVTRFHKPLL